MMQIDERDEQKQNADFSIGVSLEPGSKLTLESSQHSFKHSASTISRDDGMQIDTTSDECANVRPPIRDISHPLSKHIMGKKISSPKIA
jgi:hypothetical protein